MNHALTGNDRDFHHAGQVLNLFKYVQIRSKAELVDKLEWILKTTTAVCLIGHGFWGTISKPSWIGLITPMGFSEEMAWALLPWIGWGDIILGVLILTRPRGVWLWKGLFWCLFTALLRPLAGLSWAEVPERAGNYGIPLAFILMAIGMGALKKSARWKELWVGFELPQLDEDKLTEAVIHAVKRTLQYSIVLLLIGHGWLVAVTQTAMYFDHVAVFGIDPTPQLLQWIGGFEMLLGIFVAVRPSVPPLWFVLAWKLLSEGLYPFAGTPVDIFETIERWGDYGAPVALIMIYRYYANVLPVTSDLQT